MNRTLSIIFKFFFWQLAAITLVNASALFFAIGCDPKYGCWGSFEMHMVVSLCCALVCSLGAGLGFYCFIARKAAAKRAIPDRYFSYLVFGFAFCWGLLSYFALATIEYLHIAGAALLFAFVPVLFFYLIGLERNRAQKKQSLKKRA